LPTSSPGTTGAPPSLPAGTKQRRDYRKARTLFLFVSGLTLLGLGAVGGYLVRDRTAMPTEVFVETTISRPFVIQEASGARGVMPNVVGLSEDQARRALASAGLNQDVVDVKGIPWAGRDGVVVGQSPEPGEVGAVSATLLVSQAAVVPEVAGLTVEDARQLIGDLGARVEIVQEFEAGTPEGTVLRVTPQVGEPLDESVELVVADAASSISVFDLNALSSNCSTSTAQISGTVAGMAWVCDPDRTEVLATEYLLNRRVASFSATVGHDDRGDSDGIVSFRVYVDGELRTSREIAYGRSELIEADVSGGLRLRLEVERFTNRSESGSLRPAWAEPTLLGARSQIDLLVAEQ